MIKVKNHHIFKIEMEIIYIDEQCHKGLQYIILSGSMIFLKLMKIS